MKPLENPYAMVLDHAVSEYDVDFQLKCVIF